MSEMGEEGKEVEEGEASKRRATVSAMQQISLTHSRGVCIIGHA